jgi:hypothetical protein
MNKKTLADFIVAVEAMLAETDMAPVRRFELEHILRCWKARDRKVHSDKLLQVMHLQTKRTN